MYQYQYQHLYTGPYGLVDNYQRTIWVNTDSEKYARIIEKTFESKLSLSVVDLRKFNNFDSASINSRNCMSWQLPIDAHDIPDVTPEFTQLSTIVDSTKLVNCKSTFLTLDDRISELQDQILLFLHILFQQELVRNSNNNDATEKYLDEIKKIFLSEIHITDIENQTCALSRSYLGKSSLPGLVLNTIRRTPYA
jgi:hypothetical protein